ncbi:MULTISPECIES: glycosyl hydrolase family 18 protein [unclassified Candidatus Frackibacter]|uniref:glycosyl hydrolase family 18 protein n=1 Tax=unclassified Candidatus Frackibacter TaxID=2648818 RepID=UPI002100C1BA|nr:MULTISPECIES: glycosyl hydrolase family 18 protein [unclassified Candidatus Frackibacter]
MSSNWSGAFDYQTVGNYADQVIIMGYDYHWCGGSPGPIAPIYWLEDVIKYSLLEIPKEKLILGLPTYGYDWELESNNFAQALSYSEIMKLLSKYDVDYYWDEEAATSYFKYQSVEEEHIVWFENLKSIKKKLDLIRKYELGGVVFWRLGLEDERIWTEIEKGL